MSKDPTRPLCPHCGLPLQPFRLPDNSGWDEGIHFACFDDDCPYFRRGWAWMLDHYGVKASYRYRIDPVSGAASPLPVWSRDAVKSCILDADVTAEPVDGDVSNEKTGRRTPGAGHRPRTHPKKEKTKAEEAAGSQKKANPPRKGKAK